jgi:hypothetical protein
LSTLYSKQNGEIMKEIKIENGKYYLGNVEDLECYTKKDILKTEYQKRYRRKKSLLNKISKAL